ncbi:MAG: transposase [Niveispirillum sp.]|nr:transposase [Niveispirillum sp.]
MLCPRPAEPSGIGACPAPGSAGGAAGFENDLTLAQICGWLALHHEVVVSPTLMGVAEAISAKGAELRYLPPYSPDLNPIEQFFSKLKAILRRVGARTLPALWRSIGDALKHVAVAETKAFIQNAGYRFQLG